MSQIGKHWHDVRKPFRPTAGLTSYEKRAARDKETALIKAYEKELKEEKDALRQVREYLRTANHSPLPPCSLRGCLRQIC